MRSHIRLSRRSNMRPAGRSANQVCASRNPTRNYTKHAEASVLVEFEIPVASTAH